MGIPVDHPLSRHLLVLCDGQEVQSECIDYSVSRGWVEVFLRDDVGRIILAGKSDMRRALFERRRGKVELRLQPDATDMHRAMFAQLIDGELPEVASP